MAISSDGSFLVVADTRLHFIRKLVISTGETRLIAGSPGDPGYEGWDKIEDGTRNNEGFEGVYGTKAKFRRPSGVALTPDDRYAIIADTGKKSIILIHPPDQFRFEVISRIE
jgi:hypothetical protein